MACEQFQEQISALVDGELTQEDQSLLFAHLASCSACRQFLQEVLDVRGSFQMTVPPQAPADLDGRVFLRIQTAQAIRGRSWPMRALSRRIALPAPFAIAAGVLILVGALVFRSRSEIVYVSVLPTVEVTAPSTSATSIHP